MVSLDDVTLIYAYYCFNLFFFFSLGGSFPGKTKQILRYVSDRTGIISFANFPVVWLFGMRNSAAIWLTGWDFGTCNNFHRWIARIATLQAVVHSVGYTVLAFQG